MKSYFKIIRPLNLLLIVLAQIFLKYFLLEAFEVSLTLNSIANYSLLIFATVFIAAGGNVINDINDVTIDKINKPNKVYVSKTISEKAAYNYYMLLTLLGVGSGFILANIINKPGLAVIFIMVAALLYWYATFLKSIVLLGNITISFLVGLSVLIIVLFDIFPALNEVDKHAQILLSKVILSYAFVAMYLNLIREIVKDIQDIKGDKNGGRTTLPIVLGISRTRVLVFGLSVFAFFMLLLFCYNQLYQYTTLLFYFIFLLGGPLLLIIIKSWNASKPKDYKQISLLLKIIMFLGVFSIPLYAQILK